MEELSTGSAGLWGLIMMLEIDGQTVYELWDCDWDGGKGADPSVRQLGTFFS